MRKSHTPHTFITGSRFLGTLNHATHCMEGFGRYTYPDGSEYSGHFRKGKFHGFGRFSLSAPHHFTFIGEYEDGKLVNVRDMIFGDGVRLHSTFEGDKLNFDDWLYCTPTDRRFGAEILVGVEPVGQDAGISSIPPLRNIPAHTYDNGEGIFKPRSGCIISIPPPFFRLRFVSCDEEVEWIMKHCRRGPCMKGRQLSLALAREPEAEFGDRIIRTNINAMKEVESCACNKPSDQKSCLVKLCRRLRPDMDVEVTSMPSDDSVSEIGKTATSSSVASFTEETLLLDDIEEKCNLEVHLLKPFASDSDDTGDDVFLIEKASKATKASVTHNLMPYNL